MKQYSTVLENAVSLFVLQGFNYLLPLVTLPYLVRVLGPEKYGLTAMAYAFCQYLVVFTDYGFNMTATRKIAIFRDDKSAIAKIFWTVMTIKSTFLVLSCVIMIVLLLTVPTLRAFWPVYCAAFINVVGSVLFPVWFFQGIEKMKYITVLSTVARLLIVGAIFLLIREENDFILATALQSSGTLVAGIIAMVVIFYQFSVKFVLPKDMSEVISELRDGGRVFVATLSGNIYGQGATFITGLIAGQTAAGYYAIAQKVAAAVAGLVQPVAQALYPYLCNVFHSDFAHYSRLRNKTIFFGGISGAIIGFSLFAFSRQISLLLSGAVYHELVILIDLYGVIVVFTILNVLMNVYLLSMQKYSALQKMYMIVAGLFLCFSIPATYYFNSTGMAFSMLFVETFISTASLLIITKSRGKR